MQQCPWFADPPKPVSQPRCLLCHGFTGRATDWSAGPCGSCPAAYPIDLPGHGEAADPEGTFREAIQKLLADLPPAVDHVVGYSLGGRVALGLLQQAPARLQAATIIAAHPGLTDASAQAQRRRADQQWIDLLRQQGIKTFVEAWENQPLFATQADLPAERLAKQRAQRLAQCPEGLARCLECLGLGQMPDTWPALAAYPGQLRWVVGALDGKFKAIAARVKALRPETELQILPGVGHNPLLEWLPDNANIKH